MVRIIDCATENPFVVLNQRVALNDEKTQAIVTAIIEDVRQRGDDALLDNARRFDAPEIASLSVTEEETDAAYREIPEKHLDAIRQSIERVKAFHEDQHAHLNLGAGRWKRAAEDLGQRILPLSSAGVYVPGGLAAYPSSVIMNGMPGLVAGVPRLIVASPARKDGTLHPAVLVALREVGIPQAIKIGGAAAIAALALGTETIGRVDKIVGPGNRFVNEAKRQLWGKVGLDGYAGPSEVCVLADDTANAAWAAADLLTQIEHAEDNAGFLITLSRAKADEILTEADRQMAGALRETTMRTALKEHGMVFIARDLEEACEVSNAIAPEHLTLSVTDPESALSRIQNAGCVLLGEYTPESAGDFALGPSHTLPTAGAARFGSPVNVLDFVKVQSVAKSTLADLQEILPIIEAFGEMEGFPTHANGATIRFRTPIGKTSTRSV